MQEKYDILCLTLRQAKFKKRLMKPLKHLFTMLALCSASALAVEYHVSPDGNDAAKGFTGNIPFDKIGSTLPAAER